MAGNEIALTAAVVDWRNCRRVGFGKNETDMIVSEGVAGCIGGESENAATPAYDLMQQIVNRRSKTLWIIGFGRFFAFRRVWDKFARVLRPDSGEFVPA